MSKKLRFSTYEVHTSYARQTSRAQLISEPVAHTPKSPKSHHFNYILKLLGAGGQTRSVSEVNNFRLEAHGDTADGDYHVIVAICPSAFCACRRHKRENQKTRTDKKRGWSFQLILPWRYVVCFSVHLDNRNKTSEDNIPDHGLPDHGRRESVCVLVYHGTGQVWGIGKVSLIETVTFQAT